VRTYPALVLTAVVLAIAGAASVGAFQSTESVRRPATAKAAKAEPLQPVDPYVTPLNSFSIQPNLVMTYYLVDSVEMRDAFNRMKDELRHREWLSKSYFEVLLISSPEDESRARALIDEQKRVPLGAFVVEDLRGH
jgi:hypothetical protein